MRVVDIENADAVAEFVSAMLSELLAPKPSKRGL